MQVCVLHLVASVCNFPFNAFLFYRSNLMLKLLVLEKTARGIIVLVEHSDPNHPTY